jgi:hypothetical protein
MSPLCPTGPNLLGQSIAKYGSNWRIMFGDDLELTPGHPKKNRAYVLPDGEIVAWGKCAEGGDLTALGAQGVNNYNDFWHARRVYEKT